VPPRTAARLVVAGTGWIWRQWQGRELAPLAMRGCQTEAGIATVEIHNKIQGMVNASRLTNAEEPLGYIVCSPVSAPSDAELCRVFCRGVQLSSTRVQAHSPFDDTEEDRQAFNEDEEDLDEVKYVERS
jgi:hypothetical protein